MFEIKVDSWDYITERLSNRLYPFAVLIYKSLYIYIKVGFLFELIKMRTALIIVAHGDWFDVFISAANSRITIKTLENCWNNENYYVKMYCCL